MVPMNLPQATRHPDNPMHFNRTFLVCNIFRNEERRTQGVETLIFSSTLVLKLGADRVWRAVSSC